MSNTGESTPSYISLLKRASFRRQPDYVKVAAKIEEEIRLRDLQEKSLSTRVNHLKNRYSDKIHYVTKTIEWKMGGLGLPWVARVDDVWDQSAVYCKEFIHSKLKRLGYMGGSTKNGVRGSVAARGQRVSPVCRELTLVGSELERMYPTLYKDITKQLNVTISSEQILEQVLFDVGDAVFKAGITWARVVAFFVVSSSLSVECMQQGNGIFVHSITVALTRYVQTKLVKWITQRGGWTDLLRTFRRKRNDSGTVWLLTFGGVFLGLFLTALLSHAPYYLSAWRPEN
eukprot:XP_003730785.2 PREDICTED: bcl-2-related ovarian killer protein homolog B-like [Strongylocentrotus purpuratus]